MHWKQHTPEEIVAKLERIRSAVARGAALASATRREKISESTYFRWRALYGGLSADQLQRVKQLETENERLRRILDELEAPAASERAA